MSTTADVKWGNAVTNVKAGGARKVRHNRERLFQWLFLVPAIVYMLLFFGYPVVKNITMSFQDYTSSTFFSGLAPWVGFSNYSTVVGMPVFTKALVNTALFTIGSIIGQFVIGLALAVFFRNRFRLSGILRSLLLLPWLLPLIVSSAIWKWILDTDNGALNEFLKSIGLISTGVPWLTSTSIALLAVIVVNVWIGIPFNVTILYGGLQDIPEDLYEAGSLDGANGLEGVPEHHLAAVAAGGQCGPGARCGLHDQGFSTSFSA